MSMGEIIELLDSAYWQLQTYGDEDLDLDELLPENDAIADLWGLRQELMQSVKALQEVRKVVEAKIAAQLKKGEAVNVDGTIVRYKPGIKRSIHDTDKLWSFVQSLPTSAITELFNPNDIRIGALKRYAEELGMDAEAIEDTFFIKEFSAPRVEGVDREYAPKWAQDMESGERKVSPYAK